MKPLRRVSEGGFSVNDVRELSSLAAEVQREYVQQMDPTYVMDVRMKAVQEFEKAPIPHFGKSKLDKRNLDAYSISCGQSSRDWETIVKPYIGQDVDAALIVIADGHLVHQTGLDSLREQGVLVMNLRQAVIEYPKLVQEYLGSIVPYDENKLLALHAALWRDGLFLYLPAHAQVETPIQVIVVTTKGSHGTFSRNLIVAESGARATVLEVDLAASSIEDEVHIGVSEVIVKEDAHIKMGVVHDFPKASTNLLVHRAQVHHSAQMDWVIGDMAEGFTIAEYASLLVGEGSRSTSHAVALGSGRSHLNLTSKMQHVARFSESETFARGVMKDRSDAVFCGFTHILRGASGANGEQNERLLMLSPKSRADAIPMLLIDENDVKCGHAASVGQISEEQLFYLMSRGISEQEAKQMIVWGFVDPVLAKLPVDLVREAVERALERKMS